MNALGSALIEEPESGAGVERDDAVLVREIALGDASALDRLISRYWGPLTLYASRVVGDPTRAEEAVMMSRLPANGGR